MLRAIPFGSITQVLVEEKKPGEKVKEPEKEAKEPGEDQLGQHELAKAEGPGEPVEESGTTLEAAEQEVTGLKEEAAQEDEGEVGKTRPFDRTFPVAFSGRWSRYAKGMFAEAVSLHERGVAGDKEAVKKAYDLFKKLRAWAPRDNLIEAY